MFSAVRHHSSDGHSSDGRSSAAAGQSASDQQAAAKIAKHAHSIREVLLEMLSSKWVANFFSFEATHFEEALRPEVDNVRQLTEPLTTLTRLIRDPLLRFQQIAELKERISSGVQSSELQCKEHERVNRQASNALLGLSGQLGIERATGDKLQGFKELEGKYQSGIDQWYAFMVFVAKNIKTFSEKYPLLFNQHVFQDCSRRDELLCFHRSPFPLGWDFERLLDLQVLELRWREQTQEWYKLIGSNLPNNTLQQETGAFDAFTFAMRVESAIVPPASIQANVLTSLQLETFTRAVSSYFHSRSPSVQV